jgi:hypothetical protein
MSASPEPGDFERELERLVADDFEHELDRMTTKGIWEQLGDPDIEIGPCLRDHLLAIIEFWEACVRTQHALAESGGSASVVAARFDEVCRIAP